MNKNLYYIAVILPEPVQSEITQFKLEAQKLFNSSKALNSPAHITLVPPFKIEGKYETILKKYLDDTLRGKKSIYAQLNGWGKFDRHAIYIKVEEEPRLTQLRNLLLERYEQFLDKNRNYDKKKFVPHVTVAFRDIKKDIFDEVWKYFSAKKYFRVVKLQDIAILKHNGRKWQIFYTYKLGM